MLLLLALACGHPAAPSDAVDPSDATTDLTDAVPDVCAGLGLTARPFDAVGPYGTSRYELAEDFAVETLDDLTWRLSEAWTGCDVVVVVTDEDLSSRSFGVTLWERDLPELFEASPRNVQWLFTSDADDARSRVKDLRERLDAILADMRPKDRDWWTPRIHLVPKPLSKWEGWPAVHWAQTGYGFAIDRTQRIRDIGSLADPTRYDATVGWFGPNVSNVANEVVYYNYEVDREAALATQDATVVPLWTDETWSGARTVDVTLPSPAEMATYDGLDLDLSLMCGGPREFGTCPAWDYIVDLYQCALPADPPPDEACTPAETASCGCDWPDEAGADATRTCREDGTWSECACPCDREVGRWITTYHREGRWISDASHALPWLKAGGPQRFRFYTQQPYAVSLAFRLRDEGRTDARQVAIPLFEGGGFGANYNDGREPVTVDIPEGVTRVELAALVTGHGFGQDQANCAEFCNHTHHFTVNGHEHVKDHPMADTPDGCVQQVGVGTVPNQFGTWFYGRGGWCPGKQVDPWRVDVTADVTPGQAATLSYEGRLNGQPYEPVPANNGGFGASIRMRSWLILSW